MSCDGFWQGFFVAAVIEMLFALAVTAVLQQQNIIGSIPV